MEGLTHDRIINVLTSDYSLFESVIDQIQPSFFDNNLIPAKTWRILQSFFKKYKTIPTPQAFKDYILTEDTGVHIHESIIPAITKFYEECRCLPCPSSDKVYVEDKLQKWISRNEILSRITAIQTYLNEDSIDLARSLLEKPVTSISSEPASDLIRDAYSAYQSYQEWMARKSVPTRIPTLDVYLGGGIRSGELGVIEAGTNQGKSSFMCYLAARAVEQRIPTLFVSLENFSFVSHARILGSLIKKPCTKLRKEDFDNHKQFENLCKIIYYPSLSITVDTFLSRCRQLQRTFPYRLLIIDYIDLLRIPNSYAEKDHERSRMAYKRIQGALHEMNAAGWTVCQVNRQGLKEGATDIHAIEGAISKVFAADVVIGYTKIGPDLAKLSLLKTRSTAGTGEDGLRHDIVIKMDLEIPDFTEQGFNPSGGPVSVHTNGSRIDIQL